MRLELENNQVSDLSSYIPFSEAKEYSFYSIGDQLNDVSAIDTSGEFISIKITLDKKYSVIQRNVFSFVDLIGKIGGINQILVVFGALIASIFSYRIYMESLLSKFYKILNKNSDFEIDLKVSPKNNKGRRKNKIMHCDFALKRLESIRNESSIPIQTDEQKILETTQKLWEWINQQEAYSFKWKTVILSIFGCSKLRWNSKNKEYIRSQHLFENGCEKVRHETDLVFL